MSLGDVTENYVRLYWM